MPWAQEAQAKANFFCYLLVQTLWHLHQFEVDLEEELRNHEFFCNHFGMFYPIPFG